MATAKAKSKKIEDKDSTNQLGQKGGMDQAKAAVSPGKPGVINNPKPAKRGSTKAKRSK
ncbi:MAG: hypothetical protein V7641_289 [Blastocatellia bacterium]